MPMGLGTVALTKGWGALARYGASRYAASRRNYGASAIGKELARIKEQGALSGKYMDNILARKNRSLSSVAVSTQARTKGRLIKSGMDNSISGTRALAQPNIERMRELGYASQDLAARNEQSKVDASLTYAKGKTAYDAQTDEMKSQALGGLASDAASIASEYAVGKYTEGMDAKKMERDIAASTPIQNALAAYQESQDPAALYAQLIESGLEDEAARKLIGFIAIR